MIRARLLLPAAIAALAGCLLQQPLVRPEDAYDARADLRGDSLARFDSVEVWLEDADDSSLVALLWKGPLASADSLGVGLAGDGRKAVYVVRGYKRDRGACFLARQTREGARTVVIDTCVPVAPPDTETPPDTTHGHPPKDTGSVTPPPLPHFTIDTLELADSLPARALIADAAGRALSLAVAGDELGIGWVAADAGHAGLDGRDSAFWVRARIDGLEAGTHADAIVLTSDSGKAWDTLRVRAAVRQRYVRGKAVDWGEGLPQADIRVQADEGPEAFTRADGTYAIPVGALPGRHALRFSAPGRIGALDTLPASADSGTPALTRIPPAAAFRAIDLGATRPLGAVAAAAGYGLVLSTPPDQRGSLFLVRMDASPPRVESSFLLGNDDGDPDLPEYFEAGEMTADSDAVFIAFPDANRIGRVGNWRGTPDRKIVSVPLQPGGILRDGDHVITLGRLEDGTLALARFRAADLSLLEVDTLAGYHWDGTLPSRLSPKLAASADAYYAVDGNGPNPGGRLLKIGKADGKVEAARVLPEGELDDLAWIGGTLYVGGAAPEAHRVRGFDAGLNPVDSIETGAPVDRMVADAGGRFGAYGFATLADDRSANDTVLVFSPGARLSSGKLPVPGAGAIRWLALHPPTRTVLLSDGHRLYSASF